MPTAMPDALPTTHTARAGETWASIAYRYYGEETLLWLLIQANPLYASAVLFEGGERLSIPAAPAEQTASAMPPWRQ